MNIKNKDLQCLMERYFQVAKNKNSNLVLEDIADSIVNSIQPAINNLNKIENKAEIEAIDILDTDYDFEAKLPAAEIREDGREQMNYKAARLAFTDSFISRKPMLIFGHPGLGKTSLARDVSQSMAAVSEKGKLLYNTQKDFKNYLKGAAGSDITRRNPEAQGGPREFVEWIKISEDQKYEVLRNPQNYFVLLTMTASRMSKFDVTGMPLAQSRAEFEASEFKQTVYSKSLELIALITPNLEGFLFLDELNLADEDTISALLNLILERAVGETPMSDGFSIVAAGNIPGQGTDAKDLSTAALGRFSQIATLIVDPEGWCDWAEKGGIHPLIVGFIRSNATPEGLKFFYGGETFASSNQKEIRKKQVNYMSPRLLEAISDEIHDVFKADIERKKAGLQRDEPLKDTLFKQIRSKTNDTWAREFVTWVDEVQQYTVDKVLAEDLTKQSARQLMQIQRFLVSKLKTASNAVLQNLNRKGESLDMETNELEFIKKHITPIDTEKVFEATALVLKKLKDDVDEEFQVTLISRISQALNAEQKKVFLAFLYHHPDDSISNAAKEAFGSRKNVMTAMSKFTPPKR